MKAQHLVNNHPPPAISSTPAAQGQAPPTVTTTPSLTSPPSRPSSSSSSQIYKSGIIQIRGLIRRVWRPRYLEIRRDGTVRYYDASNNGMNLPASMRNVMSGVGEGDMAVTDGGDNGNDTLSGMAGIGPNTIPTDAQKSQNHKQITEEHFYTPSQPSPPPPNPMLSLPKAILTIHNAKLIERTTPQNNKSLSNLLPTPSHHGFIFHGNPHQFSPDALLSMDDGAPGVSPGVMSRDYICAVETEEEAREWVSAMTWASGVTNVMLIPPVGEGMGGFFCRNSGGIEKSMSDVMEDGTREGVVEDTVNTAEAAKRETTTSSSSSSSPKETKRRDGTVVVTKIRKFHPSFPSSNLIISYEIHLLLLRSSGRSSSKVSVEEFTVYRTYPEFLHLISRLRRNQNGIEDDNNDGHRHRQRRRQSPSAVKSSKTDETCGILKDATHRLSNHTTPLFTLSPSSITSLVKHDLKTLDNTLRLLTSDGALCNAPPMRDFLLLSSSTSSSQHKVASRQMTLDESEVTDDFVKMWVWHDKNDVIEWWEWVRLIAYVWMEEVICHYGVVVAVVMGGLVWMRWRGGVGGMVTIRWDVLMAVLGVVFSLGWEWGVRCDDRRKKRKHRRRRHHEDHDDDDDDHDVTIPRDDKSLPQPSPPNDDDDHDDVSDNPMVPSVVTFEGAYHPQSDDSDDATPHHTHKHLQQHQRLGSPLPQHPSNNSRSCWSLPPISHFKVRGPTYLRDRIKITSAPAPFTCRGVDMFLTEEPLRHIARHPACLGKKLGEEDTFLVNFVLPFGNFVSYFKVPERLEGSVGRVWERFKRGGQEYRDARLKLLPMVVDGPWIVRKAVGPGNAPAVLGKVMPLQYYFSPPTLHKKGIYEVDAILTASRVAKAILNVVKGYSEILTIAFAFIIEGVVEEELPETALCAFQIHELVLKDCPRLPRWKGDGEDVEEELPETALCAFQIHELVLKDCPRLPRWKGDGEDVEGGDI